MTATLVEERKGKLAWAAFRDMEFADDDLFIYELLNGELVKKSAPKPLH